MKQGTTSSLTSLSTLVRSKAVNFNNFSTRFNMLMADSASGMSEEFQQLHQRSALHPCTVAQLPENKYKNRYYNILPFDHSRVKIFPVDFKSLSDYINANYIPGCSSAHEYIASQGPLPQTIDDMWRMIWEQRVSVIVMLTQCVEDNKRKCECYWPPVNCQENYGLIKVHTIKESILPEYTIRTFKVSLSNQNNVITQLHFSKWPDFGVPETTKLLINFVRVVRDHVPKDNVEPILVHCGAGVGRTGTFIALDRVMNHISSSDNVDIFNLVLDLREHRTNMVMTMEQYTYLYKCVKELLEETMSENTTNP